METMLPPASQNPLALLASLGQQMHRLALGPDLGAAVRAAREAITLLKDESLLARRPEAPVSTEDLQGIEDRLLLDNAENLRGALQELTQIIRSLGVSSKPFLALIQNAPDQKVPGLQRPSAPVRAPRKAGGLGTLKRHWTSGEHAKAQKLLEGIVLDARKGNVRCLAQLAEIVCSDHPTVSVNIRTVADVLEAVGWHEFTLKLIDPRRTLLVPGLRSSQISPHLLTRVLVRPPATPESAEALVSVLRQKSKDPVKDPWRLRMHALQGLLALTSPQRGAVLSVPDFWKSLVEAWPIGLPALSPGGFDPRWDLYEEHLRKGFEVAENPGQPLGLRQAALASIWAVAEKGFSGPESGPKMLCLVACSRTLDLADKEPDWVWPIAGARLKQLADTGRVASERLKTALARRAEERPELPASHPAAEPQRLLNALEDFADERPPYLRLVSDGSAAPSPAETLKRLTTLAQGLGSYGLVLESRVVASLMAKVVRQWIGASGSGLTAFSPAVNEFRRAVYPLHPAAAVAAWLEQTGLPWPSHVLPDGHRMEAALSILRWIRDREKEPEEIRVDTANRYWELDRRLSGRVWRAVAPRPPDWWEERLTRELPSVLAQQIRKARDFGAPHEWSVYARNHPEVMEDVRALAQSTLPGTRSLAEQILRLLSGKAGSD